jgi:hypothetical protein
VARYIDLAGPGKFDEHERAWRIRAKMAVIVDSRRQVLLLDDIPMGFTSRNSAYLCLILTVPSRKLLAFRNSHLHNRQSLKRHGAAWSIMLGRISSRPLVEMLVQKKFILVSIIPNPKPKTPKITHLILPNHLSDFLSAY